MVKREPGSCFVWSRLALGGFWCGTSQALALCTVPVLLWFFWGTGVNPEEPRLLSRLVPPLGPAGAHDEHQPPLVLAQCLFGLWLFWGTGVNPEESQDCKFALWPWGLQDPLASNKS